ncbi:hypothetical protein AB9F45_40180, partial [Rhizobium leguminosarum]
PPPIASSTPPQSPTGGTIQSRTSRFGGGRKPFVSAYLIAIGLVILYKAFRPPPIASSTPPQSPTGGTIQSRTSRF